MHGKLTLVDLAGKTLSCASQLLEGIMISLHIMDQFAQRCEGLRLVVTGIGIQPLPNLQGMIPAEIGFRGIACRI